MTYKYGETDQHDCLYNTARAYPGGIPALAHRMEMNPKLLYKKLSPMEASNHASYEDATVTMEMCSSAGVEGALSALHAQAYRLGHICIPLPDPNQGNLSEEEIQRVVLRAMSQLGDAVTASTDALIDGHLSESEMQAIEPKIRALMPTIYDWLFRLKGRAQADAGSLMNKIR